MKWINSLLLFLNQVLGFRCIPQNTSDISAYSNMTWIRDLLQASNEATLNFNPKYGMSMNEWILNNSWGIEEWAKDGKHHFNTYFDKELNTNVLCIDIHRNDGDGSNQDDYDQGMHRVRQELKVHDKSDDIWKIRFGDYVYFKLLLKFDENFKYDLSHFYHVFQLKPMDDLSHMPVFTISVIKDDMYLSFNTVKKFGDARPVFNLYKVIKQSKILGVWLNVEVYFHPVKKGKSEILLIVRGLCGKTLHQSYITGKLYHDDTSPYIRPKIGQYHKYIKNIQYENKVYYANITTKKLDVSEARRGLFGSLLNPVVSPTSEENPTRTVNASLAETVTETMTKIIYHDRPTVTVIQPTTTTVTKNTTITKHKYTTKTTTKTKTKTKTKPCTKTKTTETTTPTETTPTETTSTETSSFQSTCVDYLNKFRASIGKSALASATADQIACANKCAVYDAKAGFHASFYANMCPGGSGQCECMGTPSVTACIDMYIREGPGGGHYDIIAGNIRSVACGQDGRGFITHNFY